MGVAVYVSETHFKIWLEEIKFFAMLDTTWGAYLHDIWASYPKRVLTKPNKQFGLKRRVFDYLSNLSEENSRKKLSK